MKIKDGYMLREIAGSWVVIPLGSRVVEFNGLISLTETSALIWRKIEEGAGKDEIISSIVSEYDIDKETVKADVEEFISQAVGKGLIEG